MTDITQAIRALQAGGIVAYPTETFYGLGASISRSDAVARLFDLKERHLGGTLSLLVADAAQLAGLAAPGALDSGAFQRLASRYWPGPLTLVVDARTGLDAALVGPDGGVAARVSSHPIAAALVGGLGAPLTATSANWRGQPPPTSAAEVRASGLADHLDFVVDGGTTAGGAPSTLVRLSGSRLRILRPGTVSREAIAETLAGLALEWT